MDCDSNSNWRSHSEFLRTKEWNVIECSFNMSFSVALKWTLETVNFSNWKYCWTEIPFKWRKIFLMKHYSHIWFFESNVKLIARSNETVLTVQLYRAWVVPVSGKDIRVDGDTAERWSDEWDDVQKTSVNRIRHNRRLLEWQQVRSAATGKTHSEDSLEETSTRFLKSSSKLRPDLSIPQMFSSSWNQLRSHYISKDFIGRNKRIRTFHGSFWIDLRKSSFEKTVLISIGRCYLRESK